MSQTHDGKWDKGNAYWKNGKHVRCSIKLYRQYGSVRKLAEALGASKSSTHRWLKGESIPVLIRMKLCEMLPEEELIQILKGPELLKRYGILDEEGGLNKPLVLALIDALMQDEALKDEVLN